MEVWHSLLMPSIRLQMQCQIGKQRTRVHKSTRSVAEWNIYRTVDLFSCVYMCVFLSLSVCVCMCVNRLWKESSSLTLFAVEWSAELNLGGRLSKTLMCRHGLMFHKKIRQATHFHHIKITYDISIQGTVSNNRVSRYSSCYFIISILTYYLI